MAIVFQHDKRSGITYAYESKSYWDKKKRQSRAKRTLVGRVDPKTKEIIPTDGRGKRRGMSKENIMQGTRQFYGANYLLDSIAKQLGLENDVKFCFPHCHKQILSIVQYLILEDSSPLFRFEKWHKLHNHPYANNITSQRSSELFASISEAQRQEFFRLQSSRRTEKEFWVYDTTSISSYSEQLKQVKRGHNKENDLLSQLNLAMVFGEQSKLPFYYRKLSGNTTDVTTIKQLISQLNELGMNKLKLVMDRGFYSASNVNKLLQEHVKFLMASKMSLKFVQQNLEPLYDNFRSFEHYDDNHKVYANTVKATWDYAQARPYKQDILKSKKRIYLHYYYNMTKAAEQEQKFDTELSNLHKELESGKVVEKHQKLYDRYFEVSSTPKRGIKAQVKVDAVTEKKRYFGFFVLISNDTMSAIDALNLYRNKDVIEKAFGNLKERLNMRRVLVSSEESLEGKIFIEFIALILLSELQNRMRNANLFSNYTLQGVLDELDLIESYQYPNKKLQIAEITLKQRELYRSLGINPPVSSL